MSSSKLIVALCLVVVASLLFTPSSSFWRRRRRSCSAVNCLYSNWGSWGSCSYGSFTKYRYRTQTRAASCGGSCNYNVNSQSTSCCFPINCYYNAWGSWSSCTKTCGSGTQTRSRTKLLAESCGGTCNLASSTARSCNTNCCPVNCAMNSWGSWSTNCPCGTTTTQYRYRYASRGASCGGSGCPSTKDSRPKSCSCCARNCQSTWSSWSSCTAICGRGTQTRKLIVQSPASCGGSACPSSSSQSQVCYGSTPVNCQMNSWSSGPCRPYNGKCGSGTLTRTRSVAVSGGCGGSSCSSYSTSQTIGCSSGCCAVNCAVNGWGNWGSCSNDCGSGQKTRSRSVSRLNQCGGTSCPALSQSTSCSQYSSRDCSVSAWSSWSQCSNLCGSGTTTRTRRITSQAYCGGSCPSLSESKACTSYASNRDCTVNSWGAWGSCNQKCAVGNSYRYRSVSQSTVCRGAACPTLSNSKSCGLSNGGCQHNCNGGNCSCKAGYLLNSDGRTCRPRDCGTPTVKYCPSDKPYPSSCVYPTFTCPKGTTYGQSCTLQCTSGFDLQNGGNAITCQSSGAWSSYKTRYCLLGYKKPTDILLSNDRVNENEKVGLVVGAFTTKDPNLLDTHTYKLIDSAGGKFSLVSGNSLTTTFTANYESPPTSYKITVRSTDNRGLYLDKQFTISINNVNERPTAIALSSSYVDENSAKGTTIGTFKTSDVDSGQSFTYTLLDDAGGRFGVTGSTLKVAASNTRCLAEGGSLCLLDYEKARSYTIKVRSIDNGAPPLYKDESFTVNLRDVNDQPRNLQLSGYTMKENAAVNTVIGDLSATDEDPKQLLTYSLSDDAGGRFALNAASQIVRKAANDKIDYETTTSYKVTVIATDNGKPPMKVSKVFTIEILDVNEPPVTITFSSTGGQLSFADDNPNVNENSAKGVTVGTLIAYDADAKQKLAFRLDDAAGNRFALKTSALTCTAVNVKNLKTKCTVPVTVNGVLNHEVDALHTIVVRVTDQHSLFKTARFSVKIVDVNDRPREIKFSGGLQPTVNENENDKALGSFTTTDDDPTDVHKYTLTDSAGGRFTIKGSTLMTTSSANLNYEAQAQYAITVRSTDSGSPPLSVDKVYTVQVKDVNEVPTDVTLKSSAVAENSAIDTVVGTLATTDPDNFKSVRQTFTYTIIDSAAGRFKVDKGVVKVALSNTRCLAYGGAECKIDYETAKSHKIVVRVVDSGSPSLQKDFSLTITITDANDKPRNLAIDAFSVKENAKQNTLVGTFTATDEDAGQTLSYKLTDDDNGLFTLKGKQLLKAKAIDYETKTSHSVTVEVTDSGNPQESMTKKFTIEVLNVNEPPVTVLFKDTGGQLSFPDNLPKVNENTVLKTVVGAVEGHDEDALQTLAFTLDDDAGGLFQVSKAAVCKPTSLIPGVKTVCTADLTVSGSLNYEGNGKHSVIVRATDKAGLFIATRFTIVVVDVNDKPTAIQLAGGSPQVVENKNGAVVGGLVTTDDDTSQKHTYKLINDAGGRFVVAGDQIKVSNSANLDYESAAQHTIVVMSTDNGLPAKSVTATFNVTILDVNEKPKSIGIDTDKVPENSNANAIVGKLSTVDPDNSHKDRQTFSYSLLNGASGRFKIDGNVVKVAVSNAQCLALGGKECALNYEEKETHDILVRSTDNGSPPMSVDYVVTISLTDVNDRPRDLDLSNDRVFENEKVGKVVGKLSATDEDASQKLTFTLLDDDNGRFKISGNELQKAISANYETSKAHTVIVQVMDSGNPALAISKNFTIEVLDVNEAPISMNFTDDNGQLKFGKGYPRVEELSSVGTVVGTIVALDYDEKETLVFRLDDDANGRFALAKAKPTCQIVTNQPGINTMCSTTLEVIGDIDHEAFNNHYVTVRATDSKGLFFTQKFRVDIVDVNDVPHDILLSVSEVKENLNDQMIGKFTTDDQDTSHSHSYRLIDDAGNRFVLKTDVLYTTSNANLNFESQSEFNVTVRSTDDGVPPLFREETFLITVLDVNEKPTSISLSNSNIAENSPVNAGVGVLTVIDPDNLGPAGAWQTHTCTATDNAGGRFVVQTNTLQVASANLNFEVNPIWPVVVRCVDSGVPSLSMDQKFVINVTDVDELPTAILMHNGTVEENLPAGQLAAKFSTVDPDNEVKDRQSFTYSLKNVPADFPFQLSGDELKTTRPLDFEANPSWKLDVETTDDSGLSITDSFQITVINVNDPPTGVDLTGSSSTPENSPGGTYVGTLSAEDEDVKDSHTFNITFVFPGTSLLSPDKAVSGLFDVDSSKGTLTVAMGAQLDYESVEEYTIEVTTIDSGSLSFTGAVTVNISDVNERPTNITLSNNQISEGDSEDTIIGDLVVSDPDNEYEDRQEHTCVVLDFPDEPFQVANQTSLIVADDSLNFEQESLHTIDVRCRDDGVPTMFVDKQFNMVVNDVNEAPILVGLTKSSVDENLIPGALVGLFTSMDPDNEDGWRQNVTYVLNGMIAPFVINGTGLITTMTFDYEKNSSYSINVTATDTGNPPASTSVKITINVTDVNDRPTQITFNSSGLKENSPGDTFVGELGTVDEDMGQTHVYSIIPDGHIEKIFYIDGKKLMLSSGSKVDFETESTYTVAVKTTDSGIPPLSYENNVIVKVIDVNERPTNVFSYNVSKIDENSPAGTFVASLTVVDQDTNQTHTCKLLNGSEYFTVVQSPSLELVVADNADIDYETTSVIRVLLQCTDDGQPPISIDHSFDVHIVDVNEPPTNIFFNGTRFLREDISVGSVVGVLSVVDPDQGQTHYFSLSGPAADGFKIDNAFRHLIVARPVRFDYEALDSPFVNVTVFAVDDGVPSFNASLELSFIVIDVNEPPKNITIAGGGDVFENATSGDVVGELEAIDPENSNSSISYVILSVNGVVNSSLFYLVTNSSGTFLTLNSSLNYEDLSSFTVEIQASDDFVPPSTTVTLLKVNVKRTDPCALKTAGCDPNASCLRTGPTSSQCQCKDGYTGDGYKCSPIKFCEDPEAVCHNGTCVDGIDSYTCSCNPGFLPPDCSRQVDECASNPCNGHGSCLDRLNGFTCVCNDGYTGAFCEVDIDHCLSSPCGPGTCIDGLTTFDCDCPSGYSGKTCSFSTQVCADGSKCKQSQCIPKSTRARLVQQTQDGDTEPIDITISIGDGDGEEDEKEKEDEEEKGYLCVKDDDVVSLPFPSKQDELTLFKEKIESYMTNELYVLVPDPDNPKGEFKAGVSFVFVLKTSLLGDESKRKRREADDVMVQVSFVVVLNDLPLPRSMVLRGLKDLCDEGSFQSEFGAKAEYTCDLISNMTENATSLQVNVGTLPRPDPEPSALEYWPIVAAVGGVALLLLSITLTLVYVRKRQRRRRMNFADASFPWDSDSLVRGEYTERSFANSNRMYLPSGEEVPDSSLVENNDDDDAMTFSNPIYSGEKEAGMLHNPIYEKREDDEERVYEELKTAF